MKIKSPISVISALLILLYVYTAASKLLAFSDFQMQMRLQVFPAAVNDFLIFTLPVTELITAALLFSPSTRMTGLRISSCLLLAFTIYIGLVLFNVFDTVPCSCGGVLRQMGWRSHFVFNLFFLLLSLIAIRIMNRERRRKSS